MNPAVYESLVLPSGFRLAVATLPQSECAAFSIHVPAGSRDDPAGEAGTAHFVEHMVFKGTPRRDARAISLEIEDAGGSVVISTPFERAEPLAGGGFRITAGGEGGAVLTSRKLITAPGLDAQEAAARIQGYPPTRIPRGHLGKGVYFRLTGKAPFERLVYPPPIPGALGTHYRKDLGGQAVFGPDLTYVEAEDYSVGPAKAGEFESIGVESTRVYRVEDARAFLAAQGIAADSIAPQVDGKFMSAFVRAVKPGRRCCG